MAEKTLQDKVNEYPGLYDNSDKRRGFGDALADLIYKNQTPPSAKPANERRSAAGVKFGIGKIGPSAMGLSLPAITITTPARPVPKQKQAAPVQEKTKVGGTGPQWTKEMEHEGKLMVTDRNIPKPIQPAPPSPIEKGEEQVVPLTSPTVDTTHQGLGVRVMLPESMTKEGWKMSGRFGITPEGETPTAVRITEAERMTPEQRAQYGQSDLLEGFGVARPTLEQEKETLTRHLYNKARRAEFDEKEPKFSTVGQLLKYGLEEKKAEMENKRLDVASAQERAKAQALANYRQQTIDLKKKGNETAVEKNWVDTFATGQDIEGNKVVDIEGGIINHIASGLQPNEIPARYASALNAFNQRLAQFASLSSPGKTGKSAWDDFMAITDPQEKLMAYQSLVKQYANSLTKMKAAQEE